MWLSGDEGGELIGELEEDEEDEEDKGLFSNWDRVSKSKAVVGIERNAGDSVADCISALLLEATGRRKSWGEGKKGNLLTKPGKQ